MSIQDLQNLVRKYANSKSWKIGWHNKKRCASYFHGGALS